MEFLPPDEVRKLTRYYANLGSKPAPAQSQSLPPRTPADSEPFARLPQELRELSQFVTWCKELRNGKPTKVPYQTNGQRADTTDPRSWTTFHNAVAAFEKDRRFDGIGFVFMKGGPYGGIDLDSCLNPDGSMQPWAQELFQLLRCVYAEISPSGKGIKAIGRVKPGIFARHKRTGCGTDGKGAVEFYQGERFFTTTGDVYGSVPQTLVDESGLEAVYNKVFADAPPKKLTKLNKPGQSRLTDDAVIALIQRSEHAALYGGNKSAYHDDDSAADLALCNALAYYTCRDPEQMDRVFRTSKLFRDKWDRDDYRQRTIAKAIADCNKTYRSSSSGGRGGEAKAQAIIKLAEGCHLFHHDGEPFALVTQGGRRYVMPVLGDDFSQHLSLTYYRETGEGASTTALKEAANTLAAKARFDGANEPVFIRVAHTPDSIYLDLADADQNVVEIRAGTWRIVPDSESPHFLRPKGIGPLPLPVMGGSVDELLPLLPPGLKRSDFTLVIYWLLSFFLPTGTLPLLVVLGPHGSAKSYMGRVLAALVDPGSDMSSPPKNLEDLIVACLGSGIVRIDNLSTIPTWLSDALCRVASGTEFVTRKFYTNADSFRAKVRRSVVANGIPSDLVSREDLRDRAVVINLPLIDGRLHQYRSESSLRAEFDATHPRILGALLTAVATAMQRLPSINAALPRMGASYSWMLAAGPALPFVPPMFPHAYKQDREASVQAATANSVVGTTILELLERHPRWEGTCKSLLAEIDDPRRQNVLRFAEKPKNATALSAEIDRLIPALHAHKIRHERCGRQSFGVVHRFTRTPQ